MQKQTHLKCCLCHFIYQGQHLKCRLKILSDSFFCMGNYISHFMMLYMNDAMRTTNFSIIINLFIKYKKGTLLASKL
jgi:hypothetical protein